MHKNYQNSLLFVTVVFFLIGIVNISFSIIGLLCFIIPFVLFKKYKEQVWCKYYCPRAGLFIAVMSRISLRKKLPKFLKSSRAKKIVLVYFVLNVFFALMSTIMVTLGRMEPIDHVRFLMAFRAPFTLPQMINLDIAPMLIHLGYRIYSIMFTSTVIGLLLGFVYMPRTWCTICPVMSLTSGKKLL
jgi:polyferredoxin